tara:strand:+ start:112470 stop:112694 length:225 start_codon:yes stop_codon:yes gene_type:complete
LGSSSSNTSDTLLARIRDSEKEAWREFVERYGTRVCSWCRSRKLNPVDTAEAREDLNRRLTEAFDYELIEHAKA